MGNVNMEAYQIHYKGEETAKTMFEKLDLIAQQVGDLPTFTSDDRAFLEKLPSLPTAEGKTVLTADTDDHGDTALTYAAPEVEGEDVAPEFSDAEAYSAGDLVFHDGILYKFTSDHDAGDWDATEATTTSVAGELSALKNTLNSYNTGRDLTVVFADEIANYSDEWAWIQARLNAHNVSGLRVGDYIPIKVGAENHLAEIAGINTYRRTGDTGHEVGYHIDWITRDCYSQTVKFNTTNNNNGNANSPSPFLASNLKSWLDGTLYPLLDAKLKNVIKAKRILAPSRYQSGATLTDDNSWAWQDFDKLWVPLETEIFDSLAWSTKGFGNGQAVQYPIFANSYEHRMKGVGPSTTRAHWWTASVGSGNSTHVVHVGDGGSSDHYNASTARFVPICFRTMEA